MRQLSRRVLRIEEQVNNVAEIEKTGSRQFTLEQVEGCKALCLAFADRFGKPNSINWNEEQENSDLQTMGHRWLKNLATIRAYLVCHPDLVEKVKAVPELETLTRLVHARIENR